MKKIIEKIKRRINSKKYIIEQLEESILIQKKQLNKNEVLISSLYKKNEYLNSILRTNNDIIENQNKKILYLKEQLSLAKINEEKVKKTVKKINGTKGGLTKQNNKLKIENENLKLAVNRLKEDLKDAMSDKYLRKEIPSGKRPRTQFSYAKHIRSKQVDGILKKINESKSNSED